MHEKLRREEASEHGNTLAPLLKLLLEKGTDKKEALNRHHLARTLYAAACEPRLNNQMIGLIQAINDTDDTIKDLARSEIKQIFFGSEEPRSDFITALATIIEDLEAPDLELNANAIQLAHSIDAWELEDSVSHIQDTGMQYRYYSKGGWREMMQEAKNFTAFRDARALKTEDESASSDTVVPLPFAKFIIKLNLNDFPGPER